MKNKGVWLSIWSLLVAIGMNSCINDDVPRGDNGSKLADDKDGNVTFNFLVPNGSSLKSSTETSDVYEEGSPEEYSVHNVTVYLFDADTKVFVKSYLLTYSNDQIGTGQGDSQTNQTICYNSKRLKVDRGTYDIFAVANGSVGTQFKDENDFFSAIDASTYGEGYINLPNQKGFFMTNRGDNSGLYSSKNKGANLNVKVVELSSTENPTLVNIVFERVVAKVSIAKATKSFILNNPKKEQYATIELTSFYPINLSTQFYAFRHTAVLQSFTKPTDYIFGEVNPVNGYVIDPYFFNKTQSGAVDFDNPDKYYAYPLGEVNESQEKPLANPANDGDPKYISFYCLENCMYKNAQKNAYSTGVRFKATVTPTEVRDVNDDIVKIEDYPEIVYYANYRFYSSFEALQKVIDVPNNDDATLSKYFVKKLIKKDGNYNCYYNYWIRHNEPITGSIALGPMEYAIVRNNIYRLLISGVSDIGSGSPEVDPGKDNDSAYLEIGCCVLPWIVRNQGGDSGVIL